MFTASRGPRASVAHAWLLALLALVVAGAASAELPVPPLERRVTDLANLLSPSQQQALEAKLAALEQETTHQVAVLTVPSLEGEAIESFSLRVVEDWQLGRADVDNGALFLVAAGDRRLRIEVGYGLEGVLPDAIASRIIRDVVIPRFRAGEMAEGIVAGTEAIAAVVRGEQVPAPPRRARSERRPVSGIATIVMMSAFLGGLVGGVAGRKRRVLGAVTGAGVAGGITWLLATSLGASLMAALLGAGLGSAGAVGPRGGPVFLPGGFGHGRGGFGGGGFGGGGFGGGGGGFGGGGASGSW